MALKILSNRSTRQKSLDVRETFILWDILASKYLMMEQLQTWEQIVSDASAKRLVQKNKKDISDNIDILEREMEKYIVSPKRKRPSCAVFFS